MDSYINTLRRFHIAHLSVSLSYDNTTNKKICYHPIKWQNTKYEESQYNPNKNALIQITGINSNIVVLDIDGMENATNKELIEICIKSCKFYNKTRKGFHFIYKYTDTFPTNRGYKYSNDEKDSGFDIKSTNGCIYYGTYYINDEEVKYENIIGNEIVDMPEELITKINEIMKVKTKLIKNKIIKYRNDNIISEEDFPKTNLISINNLDKLLSCLKTHHFTNYNEWFVIALITKHLNSTCQALDIFIKYSKMVSQYENTPYYNYKRKWDSIKYDPTFNVIGLFYMARNDNPKIFNSIHLQHIGISNNLFKSKIINSQYLDYETITKYHFANKIMAIKSPYGTGKTQILSKLFKDHYQDKRILFITSRITLSYSILQSFPNFTHYHDEIKNDLINCDKLIIQLDSLHKINQNPISDFLTNTNNIEIMSHISLIPKLKYDIIALDECESLLNHLSFSQLKTQSIYNILMNLCDNAEKIIALDGDFSNRSYEFLSSISKPIVIENIYKHPAKHFIFTNNRTTFDEKINNDLENNKNIVIISLTQKDSEYYYDLYKTKYKTIIHNSLQNDKKELININEYWKTARLLIYTSTIEAGCDFNIKWFDKCYIIISDKTASPRALMQMIHRVRHYKSNEVNVFNNGVPFYEYCFPYSYDEIKYNSFKSLCDSRGKLNPLDTILCYNKVEEINKYYFITIFINMIREKGSTYEYDKIEKPKNKKMLNNIYDEIDNANNIDNENDYNKYLEYIRKSKGNIEDLRKYGMIIKKYLLYKIWNVKPELMDCEWIKKHYMQTEKLLNYRKFIKYIIASGDAKKNNLNKRITYIQNILLKFGITNEDDFKYSIENGLDMEDKKINKKGNPNIIDANKYNDIIKDVNKIVIDKDFRQIFDLPKLKKKEITEREILETIKKVIGEYGFQVNIVADIKTTYKDEKKINKRENKYFIDLIPSIIDMYHRELYILVDEIEEIEI